MSSQVVSGNFKRKRCKPLVSASAIAKRFPSSPVVVEYVPRALTVVQLQKRGANPDAASFMACVEPMCGNAAFWTVMRDIKTLCVFMQSNKYIYNLLSSTNNLLPYWSIWTRCFRPHAYNEFRTMFGITR
jgi:hypothetical protein